MCEEKNQPYFYNPDLTPEQLEDWLTQQKNHIFQYNKMMKEKSALEERLREISERIEYMAERGIGRRFTGKMNFPWVPILHITNHQKE